MIESQPSILVVEDDADDLFLLERAFKKANLNFRLQPVSDGQEAIDYLSGNGKFSDRLKCPIPALVLLDLKLPYLDGFEVLTWLRANASLKQLPVIVLTSSSEDRDRKRAGDLGVRGYLVKPATPEMLRKVLTAAAAGPIG